MSSIPPRENRVQLVVDEIRREIAAGSLTEVMPGERELAKRLKVGRVTVASAMKQLEREGWVSASQAGSRRRILKQAHTSVPMDGHQVAGKTVVVLSPVSIENSPPYERLNHTRLHAYCADAGISLRHRALDLTHYKKPGHRLAEFVKQYPADLYLLQLASREMQEWFERKQIACVVLGSTWSGSQLPSVDVDHRALGVHAAGLLKRLGHQRIGLLFPQPARRGVQLFVEGVREGDASVLLELANCEESRDSMKQAVVNLLSQDQPPSVIVLPRVSHALATASLLANSGVKVPETISLVCLVHDEMFSYVHPTLAGYRVGVDQFAKAVLDKVVRILRSPVKVGVNFNTLILPEFVQGLSLKQSKR